MFLEADKPLLKKLKVRTLLDLALTLPSSYKDTTLSKELKQNSQIIARALVQSANIRNSKLFLRLYLEDFNTTATAIFFKTTPYHTKLFKVGSHHIISGRLSTFRGELQIAQPKSLKSYGKVEGVYKTLLKESEVKYLISKYINKENLLKYRLNESEIETILSMHFVDDLNKIFDENGDIKKHHLKNLKTIEAINYILKLKRKRVYNKPFISLDSGDLDKFLNALPFKLTDDQLNAINDIKRDFASTKKAAKRIIIGDVGSGKTMVILAAAAIASKHKSILMAPTSILANQIYQEAKKYLGAFLKVALITQKHQDDYKDADFIIGTHALLYKSDLPKAAVVMVDEQHRFGTNQRATLAALVKRGEYSAHYLQFSATPIPRTQAMIESSAIDISLIKQLPFKKLITTKIIGKSDFANLKKHIEDEIAKGHQVLIVYPLVEPSDEINYTSLTEAVDYWKKHFNNVYVTYGKDNQKDSILEEFRDNGDILLSTTVIEVGISLPRLTTIVIVGAERFGLATLHQLRGRVGRYGIESYCYLYTNAKTPPKRLIEFSKILDGFEIARLDLKYRNSGDLLDGTIQSGKAFRWLDLSEDEEIIIEAKNRVG